MVISSKRMKRIFAAIPRLHLDHPAIFAPALVAVSIVIGVAIGRLTSPTPDADALHAHIAVHLMARDALRANMDCADAKTFEDAIAARSAYLEVLYFDPHRIGGTFSQSVYDAAVDQQAGIEEFMQRSIRACMDRLAAVTPRGMPKEEVHALISARISPILNPKEPDTSRFE